MFPIVIESAVTPVSVLPPLSDELHDDEVPPAEEAAAWPAPATPVDPPAPAPEPPAAPAPPVAAAEEPGSVVFVLAPPEPEVEAPVPGPLDENEPLPEPPGAPFATWSAAPVSRDPQPASDMAASVATPSRAIRRARRSRTCPANLTSRGPGAHSCGGTWATPRP